MTVSEKHREIAEAAFYGRHERGFVLRPLVGADLNQAAIDRIAAALDTAEREGMRRAVQIIREGYPRPVAIRYRKDGKPSNHDKCAHHFYMIEDCEECAIAAILSQAGEA